MSVSANKIPGLLDEHHGDAGGYFSHLDALEAESQFKPVAASLESPESMFDRAWAETVIQASVERLRAECQAEGKAAQFGELKMYLSRPADRRAYASTGRRLGMSADAVTMAVMRLRRRYRAMVRAEVADTVTTPAEIDQEVRYLIDLLTR